MKNYRIFLLLILPFPIFSQSIDNSSKSIIGINFGVSEFDAKVPFEGDVNGLQSTLTELFYQRQFKSNLVLEIGGKFLKSSTSYRGWSYGPDITSSAGSFEAKRLEVDLFLGYKSKLWPWTYIIAEMGVINSLANEKAEESKYNIINGRWVTVSNYSKSKDYYDPIIATAASLYVQFGSRFRIKNSFRIGYSPDGRRRIEVEKGLCLIVNK